MVGMLHTAPDIHCRELEPMVVLIVYRAITHRHTNSVTLCSNVEFIVHLTCMSGEEVTLTSL